MLSLKLSRGAAPSEDPSMSTTYIIEGELNMCMCMYVHVHMYDVCIMGAAHTRHITSCSCCHVARRLRGSSLLLADRLHRSNTYK